jgi:hypothetical protein
VTVNALYIPVLLPHLTLNREPELGFLNFSFPRAVFDQNMLSVPRRSCFGVSGKTGAMYVTSHPLRQVTAKQKRPPPVLAVMAMTLVRVSR